MSQQICKNECYHMRLVVGKFNTGSDIHKYFSYRIFNDCWQYIASSDRMIKEC
jgi:hypothetical protein